MNSTTSDNDLAWIKTAVVGVALLLPLVLGTVGIVSWSNVEQAKLHSGQPTNVTCMSTDSVSQVHKCEVVLP